MVQVNFLEEIIMKYSNDQLQSINKVREAFAEYIKETKEFELLWSDKVGYIFLGGLLENMEGFCMHPEIIYDSRKLCRYILYQIAYDEIKKCISFHDVHQSSPSERENIKAAALSYMKQLPEYADLMDEIFIDLNLGAKYSRNESEDV